MCGITGFWDRVRSPGEAIEHQVQVMCGVLRHRGPDDGGTFVDDEAGVALGSRRLAILDLSSTGHQPMTSADGRYVASYNGEIYNFPELRSQLERGGHRFRGSSDTEVLVAAIQRWGFTEALKRSEGMFAVAVWDRAEQRLHLARDRFGEKPLYFGWSEGVFLFGSELKALRAHPRFRGEVDRDALSLYFRHNCIPAPYSIYRGIFQLRPGTCLTVDRDTSPGSMPRLAAFWSFEDLVDEALASRQTRASRPSVRTRRELKAPGPTDPEVTETIDELHTTLSRAVGMRMRADVPYGAFLSGGTDSSLVVSLMQEHSSSKVRTFTIAFDDLAYDEADDARNVAKHLGTDHTELVVTADDALSLIPSLPTVYDEPFADSSQLPTTLLAKLTRRHVTVALSGDGGDELFAGYNRYQWARRFYDRVARVPMPVRKSAARALGAIPPDFWDRAWDIGGRRLPRAVQVRMPGTKIQKVARVLPAASVHETHLILASHFEDPASLVIGSREPATMLSGGLGTGGGPDVSDPVEQMMYLDTLTYLPDDILTKVDRATMAASLEGRMPFLDQSVARLAWSLPVHLKMRGHTGKWILRELLYRFVPREMVDRPKAGFGVPLDSWLRGPLREWAEELLDPKRIADEGFLSPTPVRRLWQEHLSGLRSRQYELWDVLMFQAWLETTR
jgi:asparagine synthase (glutamine-hydrolysing)